MVAPSPYNLPVWTDHLLVFCYLFIFLQCTSSLLLLYPHKAITTQSNFFFVLFMQANEKENAKRRLIPLPYIPYMLFGAPLQVLWTIDVIFNTRTSSLSVNVLTSDKCVGFPSAHHLKWVGVGRRRAMGDGSWDGRANGAYQHLMQTLWKTRWVGSLKSPTGSTLLCQTCAFVMSVLSLASQ